MAHLRCDGGRRVVVLKPPVTGDGPIARHRADGTMCFGALSICGVDLEFELHANEISAFRLDGQPRSTLTR